MFDKALTVLTVTHHHCIVNVSVRNSLLTGKLAMCQMQWSMTLLESQTYSIWGTSTMSRDASNCSWQIMWAKRGTWESVGEQCVNRSMPVCASVNSGVSVRLVLMTKHAAHSHTLWVTHAAQSPLGMTPNAANRLHGPWSTVCGCAVFTATAVVLVFIKRSVCYVSVCSIIIVQK